MNTLNNVMSKNVISISSNQSIQEAASLMSQHNIGALPVVDHGALQGIITDRDITLRSTAQGEANQTPVSQVMSSDIVSGNPGMSMEEASQLMSSKQIRRLPVVDNNNLVGMVALGDLATSQASNESAGSALSNISEKNETR